MVARRNFSAVFLDLRCVFSRCPSLHRGGADARKAKSIKRELKFRALTYEQTSNGGAEKNR